MQARHRGQLDPLLPRGAAIGGVSNASTGGLAVVEASGKPPDQGIPSVLEKTTPAQGEALGESDESKADYTEIVSTSDWYCQGVKMGMVHMSRLLNLK